MSIPDEPAGPVEAIAVLRADGYDLDFNLGHDCPGSPSSPEPGTLEFDRVFRFEGASDPDDEAMVLGLRCSAGGARGVFVSGYGVSAPDAPAIVALVDGRPTGELVVTGFLLADAPVPTLEAYFASGGGGEGLELARTLGPERTIEQLALAGLRGRGGAGFPTADKWRSVVGGGPGDRYVVCNAAEGEPGTFKDRTLLRANPYQVIEGLLIAAAAVGAHEGFVGLKASFVPERVRVETAIAELAEVGMLEDVRLRVVLGPDEYLFGEEKALLEVIEGQRAAAPGGCPRTCTACSPPRPRSGGRE